MANFTTECFYKYKKQYSNRLHEDYLFAEKYFLKGHSCSYRCELKKPLKILHLYTKNKFQIFIYNTILFFKFYLRRLFKNVKNR